MRFSDRISLYCTPVDDNIFCTPVFTQKVAFEYQWKRVVLIFLPARRISVNLDVRHGQRQVCVPLGHSSLYFTNWNVSSDQLQRLHYKFHLLLTYYCYCLMEASGTASGQNDPVHQKSPSVGLNARGPVRAFGISDEILCVICSFQTAWTKLFANLWKNITMVQLVTFLIQG